EIREELSATFWKDAPIIGFSAIDGRGLGEVVAAIDALAQKTITKPIWGKPRLAIDKAFHLPGFGPIATGTLLSGNFRVGDKIELLSQGHRYPLRIRFLQVHGQPKDQAEAGQRVAFNLSGCQLERLKTGSWLCGEGLLSFSYRLDLEISLLSNAKALQQRARVHIHHGTAVVLGRVNLLDREELQPGEKCFCQLLLEKPLAALREDRLIIRSYSPVMTIGGGIILDPLPLKHKRYDQQVLAMLAEKAQGDPVDILQNVFLQNCFLTQEEAVSKAFLVNEESQASLAELLAKEEIISFSDKKQERVYLSSQKEQEFLTKALMEISQYQKKFPLRDGMSREELKSRSLPFLTGQQWQLLLNYWLEQGALAEEKGFLHTLAWQKPSNDLYDHWYRQTEKIYLQKLFSPPPFQDVADKLAISAKERGEVYLWFCRSFLIKIDDVLAFHRQAEEAAKKLLLEAFAEKEALTLAEIRDIWQTSRKYALALAEYLDNIRFTVRNGEKRSLYK
ncbi:MAG: SelB C-terminal domain-containing protein, partial [Clostridiales bacterium]